MAYQEQTDRPNNSAPDLSAFFDSFLNSEDTGIDFRQETTGVSLGKELLAAGMTQDEINEFSRRSGLDVSTSVGYGATDREKGRLLEILNTIRQIKAESPTGNTRAKLENQLYGYLATDAKRFGLAEQRTVSERREGFAGLSMPVRAQKIREWQQQNPGKDFATLNSDDQARIFGIAPEKYSDDDKAAANAFIKSEKYQQYNIAQDIFRTGLELQRETQQRFLEAQKRINEPGYAQKTIDEAYKPAETAFNQYWNPTEGNKFSQAAMEVGAGEAALGRTGSDRVAAELARQKGLSQQQFQAQKSAAVSQLQQYIDFNNPAEALRYGAAAGQGALAGQEVYRNQLLNPYAQVFPLMFQSQQANLLPFSYQTQVQRGPSAFDYGLALADTGVRAYGAFATGGGSEAMRASRG